MNAQDVEVTEPPQPSIFTFLDDALGTTMKNWYFSGKASVVYLGSTTRNDQLERLQLGGDDVKERGFTAKNFSLGAGVDLFDEYLGTDFGVDLRGSEAGTDEARLSYAELRSNFARGWAVTAGKFTPNFGIVHQFDSFGARWMDAPVIHSRILGDRKSVGNLANDAGLGVKFSYHNLPRAFRIHVGVQEAWPDFLGAGKERFGWVQPGFEKKGFAMDGLVWSFRGAKAFSLGECAVGMVGGSVIVGPNSSGNDGQTLMWEFDARVDGFVNDILDWQFIAEAVGRSYKADNGLTEMGELLPSTTFSDWGVTVQGSKRLGDRVGLGIRYDYATANRGAFDGTFVGTQPQFRSRSEDAFRHDRHRISAMMILNVPFFGGSNPGSLANPVAQMRLQYNYDRAPFLKDDEAHTFMVVFDTAATIDAIAGNK